MLTTIPLWFSVIWISEGLSNKTHSSCIRVAAMLSRSCLWVSIGSKSLPLMLFHVLLNCLRIKWIIDISKGLGANEAAAYSAHIPYQPWLLHFWPASLLICLEKQPEDRPSYSGLCQPQRRPDEVRGSWFDPCHCSYLEYKPCLPLLLHHSAFQTNKSFNKQRTKPQLTLDCVPASEM